MDQLFVDGIRYFVTWIKAGPCVVTKITHDDQTNYWFVQLGFGEKRIKNTTKPMQGHLNKIKNSKLKIQNYPRYLREVKSESEPQLKVGDVVLLKEVFEVGNNVVISGVSKGKGFAGVVKRHGFAGGPKTHGQSDRWRAPGSIGQGTTPGRVWKGKKMAGRMGGITKSIKGLKIMKVEEESGRLAISGGVPGRSGGLVTITKEVSK